jgi:uncharacterized protein
MQKMPDKLTEIPVFPLNTNVLPEGLMPLQIFEPRYIDMVKFCMKSNLGFIVLLDEYKVIDDKSNPKFSNLGTYVEIIDFDKLDNGLLGITVKGRFRTRILNSHIQDDGLHISDVEKLSEENSSELQDQFKNIWQVLKEISDHPEIKKMKIEIDFSSSSSVIYNLGSLLPLSSGDKQQILEASSDIERLELLDQLIVKFGGG